MFEIRTFILGAGFSFPAGLPLTDELGVLLADRTCGEHSSPNIRDWVASLVATIDGATHTRLNAEQLFEAAYTLRDLVESQVTIPTSADLAAKVQDTTAEGIELLNRNLVEVIWERERKASLDHVTRFASSLRAGDNIISFNYDTLVERALSSLDKQWNYVLSDFTGGEGVRVLKLHGSINWLTGLETWFSDAPLMKLWSATDWPNDPRLFNSNTDSRSLFCILDIDTWLTYFLDNLCAYPWSLALAPLGARKRIRDVPGLGRLWATARQFIESSHSVYVVGFSLSPYDHMTRWILLDSARPHFYGGRPEWVIIDPDAKALATRYERAARTKVATCSCKAEDVNWSNLKQWLEGACE